MGVEDWCSVFRGWRTEVRTYRWVIVSKCIINAHVFKVMSNVGFEKSFDFFEVEFRIDKYGANIGFNYVGKALQKFVSENDGNIFTIDQPLEGS